jgi:RNA polymerase sporulation-specific sigma factor
MANQTLTTEILGNPALKNKFIEDNLKFVHYIVRKFNVPPQEYEDYVQIGSIGLVKAVNKFDVSKGFVFASFAVRCIENHILTHKRNNKKSVYATSFENVVMLNKDSKEKTLEDVLSDGVDVQDELCEQTSCNSIMNNYLSNLKDRDKSIITLLMNGKKQREIEDIVGLSQAYISRLIKKLRAKLINEIDDYNGEKINRNVTYQKDGEAKMSSKFITDSSKLIIDWAIENIGENICIEEILRLKGENRQISYHRKKKIKEYVIRILEVKGYTVTDKGRRWYANSKGSDGIKTYQIKDDPELAKRFLDNEQVTDSNIGGLVDINTQPICSSTIPIQPIKDSDEKVDFKEVFKAINKSTDDLKQAEKSNSKKVVFKLDGYLLDGKGEYVSGLIMNIIGMFHGEELTMNLTIERD